MNQIASQLLLSLGDQHDWALQSSPRSLDTFVSESYSPYPNQALRRFVESNVTAPREPQMPSLPESLTAGKNTYVYDAHTYHTKVPPQAILCLMERFTQPGDLVLDPFCGSGMTGVAALKARCKPVLIDLSPAATFIALNFLTPMDGRKYIQAIQQVLTAEREEELLLYGTRCRRCGKLVPMEYMVWSYGLICEFCQQEFVLWDVARDERKDVRESKIKTEFACPHCGRRLQKRKLRRTCTYPVQVGYRCCDSGPRESQAIPDDYDLSVICAANSAGVPRELWYPTARLPNGDNTRQAIGHGLESVDALYTPRNLRAVARLWDTARRWSDTETSLKLMFTVTSLYQRVTRLSEFRFWGGSGNIANYNVPMIFNEQNVFKVFERKAKTIQYYLETWGGKPAMPFCISTQSATDLSAIPDNSIDYIFTDPPFGGNINYSEMNYIWEAWLGAFTDTTDEAIINRSQHKTLETYGRTMMQALQEMYRVLKAGRWLTLVFHNSSAQVWATIQAALASSGFRIEAIQTLDKRHGTFKQFVSKNTVGYDLVIHCTKSMPAGVTVSRPRVTCQAAVRQFVERTFRQNPDEFLVRYLHVKRQNELDSRKLYSLWLKEQMESGQVVDLDYEEFREAVNRIILDLPTDRTQEAKQ